MKDLIKVENLHKRYGDNEVLKGLSFTINEREIVGVVGPNGTGKTTLLEILMTLKKFQQGTIRILGNDVNRQLNEIRNEIGIVLQEGGIYNYMKLKEALDLFASFYGVSTEKVKRIISQFQLEPHLNTKFSKMSGGWKQRCLLAVAFIHNPRLIFLDEPTTGLDPKATKILWNQIVGAKENDRTILLSTHSMEEIDKYCDRVMILKDGDIMAFDTPENLKKQHNKQYFNDVYFHYIDEVNSENL